MINKKANQLYYTDFYVHDAYSRLKLISDTDQAIPCLINDAVMFTSRDLFSK